jgi:hypothetical protein
MMLNEKEDHEKMSKSMQPAISGEASTTEKPLHQVLDPMDWTLMETLKGAYNKSDTQKLNFIELSQTMRKKHHVRYD